MTLSEFLSEVDATPEPDLRVAMTRALVGEVPHTDEQYRKFYGRVVAELESHRASTRLHAVA